MVALGGIVGWSYGFITNCYNEAEVTAASAGGICCSIDSDYGIENCYNLGTIIAVSDGFAAGIVSDTENGFIRFCYNKGTIIGNNAQKLAGIDGNVTGVEDCYNAGIIKGSAEYVSGIYDWGDNINCYNIGKIDGESEHFGPISSYPEEISTNTNCYYLSETPSDTDVEGSVEAKTSAFMKTQEFVDLLNAGREEKIWKMDTNNINNGYPILFWQ